MNAEKAAYWLALTAFGFALLDVCPRGALQNLNHALGHTGSTLCRLAASAERAVMASALVAHPRFRTDSLSASGARELAQQQTEHVQKQVERVRDQHQVRDQYQDQYEDQIEEAQNQAEQARDRALAAADATREQALANAEAASDEALAKAEAIREQAFAQGAVARAEGERKRAAIDRLRVRVHPQIHLTHAANGRFLVMSNDLMSKDLMSGDPCDYSRMSDAVRASIELSDAEQ